ncbi:MAG: oxidoreductase [Anaerolineaceae bacterium]|nr:oxidoreductase [Anaerolineaceae bacterium]
MRNGLVNLAVIGVGAMGSAHARDIFELPNTNLVAVCDLISERAEYLAKKYQCKAFTDYQNLINLCDIDAVIISVPHYDHTPISIDCFSKGIHVLTEKPIAVHVADAKKMIGAYQTALRTYPNLKFGIMFQQRTYGFWKKVKSLLNENELGKIIRATWIITDWYRTQNYYDNGNWRATWRGEGGGVLLNQSPHNLDLFQWFFGMPNRVTGFVNFGKYHAIEVEDEVTAVFEYENGFIGHFITSTAESPGTNRLEIVGELGKLVVENEKLTFWRNRYSMLEDIITSNMPYTFVENWKIDVPFTHHGKPGHDILIENFANSILQNEPLIVPGEQGINQIHLGNSIMLSGFLGKPVNLPIDADLYAQKLEERIRNSKFLKTTHIKSPQNLVNSFDKP